MFLKALKKELSCSAKRLIIYIKTWVTTEFTHLFSHFYHNFILIPKSILIINNVIFPNLKNLVISSKQGGEESNAEDIFTDIKHLNLRRLTFVSANTSVQFTNQILLIFKSFPNLSSLETITKSNLEDSDIPKNGVLANNKKITHGKKHHEAAQDYLHLVFWPPVKNSCLRKVIDSFF